MEATGAHSRGLGGWRPNPPKSLSPAPATQPFVFKSFFNPPRPNPLGWERQVPFSAQRGPTAAVGGPGLPVPVGGGGQGGSPAGHHHRPPKAPRTGARAGVKRDPPTRSSQVRGSAQSRRDVITLSFLPTCSPVTEVIATERGNGRSVGRGGDRRDYPVLGVHSGGGRGGVSLRSFCFFGGLLVQRHLLWPPSVNKLLHQAGSPKKSVDLRL